MAGEATIKIRTKYERASLAVELARKLREHDDPYVQEMALAIEYVLSAPIGTLNNVLDQFPHDAKEILRRVVRVHGLPLKRKSPVLDYTGI